MSRPNSAAATPTAAAATNDGAAAKRQSAGDVDAEYEYESASSAQSADGMIHILVFDESSNCDHFVPFKCCFLFYKIGAVVCEPAPNVESDCFVCFWFVLCRSLCGPMVFVVFDRVQCSMSNVDCKLSLSMFYHLTSWSSDFWAFRPLSALHGVFSILFALSTFRWFNHFGFLFNGMCPVDDVRVGSAVSIA